MHSLRRWTQSVPMTGWFDDGQGNAFEARVVRSGNHATGLGDIKPTIVSQSRLVQVVTVLGFDVLEVLKTKCLVPCYAIF